MIDILRRWKNPPPISRWHYGLGLILVLQAIEELRTGWDHLFAIIYAGVILPAWAVVTVRRLVDLRLSPWWMIPVTIPVLTGLIAVFKGSELQLRLALGIAFIALLPPFFVSKGSDQSSEPIQSSEQNPS